MATIEGNGFNNSFVGNDTQNDSIWGAGGDDLIDGGPASGGGNDFLDGGTGIDRLYGGDGDDTLIGGNDTANDSLFGGAGTDTADYSRYLTDLTPNPSFTNNNTAVNVNLATGVATGRGTDSLSSIENVLGGGGADIITGNDAANLLYGGGGADILYGGIGVDTIDGGAGSDTIYGGADNDLLYGGADTDTLSYANAAAGVSVNLTTGIATGEGTDTISQFENVIGSSQADLLTGDGGANRLDGGAGNDTLAGGLGNDTLVGGTGVDTASFINSATAVNANLLTNTSTGEGTDSLSGIENLTGSALNDTLAGDHGNNVITGEGGRDAINGNLGNDTIDGGAGDDTIVGGPESATTGTVPLEFNWSSFGDETPITTGGTTLDVGGVNVAVSYTPGVADEFTIETGTPIYVAGGETFNTTSSAYLSRPGAGAATSVEFNFTSVTGSNLQNDVQNVQFRISDIDRQGWTDRITVTAFDSDGNPVTVIITESSSELTVTGNTIVATGNNTDADELDGSALYTIPGPVSRIVISYDNLGTAGQIIHVSDIHFDAVPLDDDSLTGGAGNDSIVGGSGNDSLYGLDDNDTLYGGAGTDQLYGGTGIDSIFGGLGNDAAFGGNDGDFLFGESGDDTLSGDAGNDLANGGLDNDLIYGGGDQDTLYGDAENDTLFGDAGNDRLFGGVGNDLLYGGTGSDTLYGGAGADTVFGGDDRDNIFVGFNTAYNSVLAANDVANGEIVDGGSGGDDNDTLTVDITGFGWSRIELTYDPLNIENGTITFYAADGTTVIGTLAFTEIENVVIVCFTPGTQILTSRGPVAVETLRAGDLVVTRDNGLQPLRWVGSRTLSYADLLARPELQPIRIGAGAIAGAGPDRTMLVSPQHRVLIEGARAEMYFGESEVLVPAKHLLEMAEVTRALPSEGVTYVHILFDRHEIVQSDGLWTESFQPAERTLNALDAQARTEVLELFPELAIDTTGFTSARLSLRAHEAKVLVSG